MPRPFAQVDVFSADPLGGNPVAVVLDAEGVDDAALARFANWTNLSETTFVLPPRVEGADYRVRIFTTELELPFAGHPTLGTCHAWLETAGRDHAGDEVVQECGAGLVRVRRGPEGLAFAAPPLRREGPVDEDLVAHLAGQLGIARADVVDAQWADNGPGWVALLLESADAVLAVRPGRVDHDVGLVGPHPPGAPEAFEVRAFVPAPDGTVEDPVTGSLNASLAGWLLATGRASAPYVARQGTAVGRTGRVRIDREADGTVWVGGATRTVLSGTVEL